MDVGRLNKRITFVQMTDKENSLGQLVKVQEPVKTVWATVSSTKGKEQQEANKIRPELNYDIYTRYFPWITSDMLIKYNGKILEMIEPPADKDEKHEYLYIRCTEYQKKG